LGPKNQQRKWLLISSANFFQTLLERERRGTRGKPRR
jgi:hypothetical protein